MVFDGYEYEFIWIHDIYEYINEYVLLPYLHSQKKSYLQLVNYWK